MLWGLVVPPVHDRRDPGLRATDPRMEDARSFSLRSLPSRHLPRRRTGRPGHLLSSQSVYRLRERGWPADAPRGGTTRSSKSPSVPGAGPDPPAAVRRREPPLPPLCRKVNTELVWGEHPQAPRLSGEGWPRCAPRASREGGGAGRGGVEGSRRIFGAPGLGPAPPLPPARGAGGPPRLPPTSMPEHGGRPPPPRPSARGPARGPDAGAEGRPAGPGSPGSPCRGPTRAPASPVT